MDVVIGAVESLRKPFRSIVGGADGFDTIVWEVLCEFGLPRMRFDAKWKKYGNKAGPIRNGLMLAKLRVFDPFGFVIAGWDGSSPGTRNCIEQAKRLDIDVWRVAFWQGANA